MQFRAALVGLKLLGLVFDNGHKYDDKHDPVKQVECSKWCYESKPERPFSRSTAVHVRNWNLVLVKREDNYFKYHY